VGLGLIVSGAKRVPDEMFLTSARTLAAQVGDADLARGSLFPPVERIRVVAAAIAASVARLAYDDGLASNPEPADLPAFIESSMYHASYESDR
jgi:malate dehydrogenase (oxaloacetate-decarboxylating)(NADP+)